MFEGKDSMIVVTKRLKRGGGLLWGCEVSYENALWVVWWLEKVDKQQIHIGGAKHL